MWLHPKGCLVLKNKVTAVFTRLTADFTGLYPRNYETSSQVLPTPHRRIFTFFNFRMRWTHSFQIHENAVYPYKPYQSTARICKGIRPYSCLISYPGIETSVPVRPWHLAVLSASIGFWTITYTVFVEFSSKIWQKSFWSNIKYCYLTILTIYGLS